MKNLITLILLFVCIYCNSQTYFEGEIIYGSEVEKKDSSFDLTNIISYPSKKSEFFFKNGNWIQIPDTGMIEYQYFNHEINRMFYKLRGGDTLVYNNYENRTPEQDSVLSITEFYNTDTILGMLCNRLVLQTGEMKLTLVYSPDIKVNPDWFSKTKGGYYDIIYSRTRALYLMFILETDRFISKGIAEKIIHKSVPDNMFPDIDEIPYKKL